MRRDELIREAGIYCRIDRPYDPAKEDVMMLSTMVNAAVSYLEQAGVRDPGENQTLDQTARDRKALYELCVCHLVLDSYDSRGANILDGTATENPAFRRMLNQLKLTEPPVSDSDTGAAPTV